MLPYLAGVSVVGTIGFGLFYLYDETTAISNYGRFFLDCC